MDYISLSGLKRYQSYLRGKGFLLDVIPMEGVKN